MSKHALLIIAHSNEKNLINLIKSIDFYDNYIYIHLDKKWKNVDYNRIIKAAKFSKINIFSQINVVWGGSSQVFVEMLLFEKAFQEGEYDYYHLLSGQDICIKQQSELHRFFDENRGKEFISFCKDDWQKKEQNRVKYYYMQSGRSRFKIFFNRAFVFAQKILRIDRRKNSRLTFVGGSNWVSVTGDFCKYLLQKKDYIFKVFGRSFCADELFVQTMAYNSPFKQNLFIPCQSGLKSYGEEYACLANMRKIDWNRGSPYTFVEDDYEEVISSPYIFVRKVDEKSGLPDKILKYLGK